MFRPSFVSLMGPSGSGKSTVRTLCRRAITVQLLICIFEQFMQMATRQNVNTVGHELQSSKSAIRAAEVFHPMTNERLILVDTPGLDDTKLDLELLKIMAAWLQKK